MKGVLINWFLRKLLLRFGNKVMIQSMLDALYFFMQPSAALRFLAAPMQAKAKQPPLAKPPSSVLPLF